VQQLLLEIARGEDVMAVALDIELVDRDGNRISIEDNAQPVRNAHGETAGVVVVFRDTTKQKERRRQIEDFNGRLRQAMAESNHRIKNNLQIVAALVDLYAEEEDESAAGDITKPKSARQKLRLHIQTLAQLHDFLTEESKTSEDVTYVPADETLAKLIPLVQSTVGNHVVSFSSDAVRLSTKQSASLALIVNELVSNAVKHGKGGVDVSLVSEDDSVYLDVIDDGPGFPDGFDLGKNANNGLALAQGLARTDLDGELLCVNRDEGGACVRLRFSVN
jgi:two-component sensor histidine kinase